MSLDHVLNLFRAVGEETRLRIVALLRRGELTVTEITQILGQSQPRVSRHLKILADAGLVERHREGSWIFYRFASDPSDRVLMAVAIALDGLNEATDRVIARDRERFQQSREARDGVAAAYFETNAANWERVRGLHIAEAKIEQRMHELLGDQPIGNFVDFGTGTGRMLTVFSDLYTQGVGFDASREMLAVARAKLDEAGVAHAQVRLGDIFSLPLPASSADVVCVHHVLHFLAEPAVAVSEAARLLQPGGRLIISDFAPHNLEFLREEHAHRRLGFTDDEVGVWCRDAGLERVNVVSLQPEKENSDGLTVKVWLYRLAGQAPSVLTRGAQHKLSSVK